MRDRELIDRLLASSFTWLGDKATLKNLVIIGRQSAERTALANQFAKVAEETGREVVRISHDEIAERVKHLVSHAFVEGFIDLIAAEVLVIDALSFDVSGNAMRVHSITEISWVIRRRMELGLTTIVTTEESRGWQKGLVFDRFFKQAYLIFLDDGREDWEAYRQKQIVIEAWEPVAVDCAGKQFSMER